MRPEQIYKYRIDYQDWSGKLVRIWSRGRFSRLGRLQEKINVKILKLRAEGCRPIAWEIWNTKESKCVDSCVLSLDK